MSKMYGDAALLEKAEKIKQSINKKAITKDGFYCDNTVYGDDGIPRLSGKCTETCQYYAFFCDIATIEDNKELWNRMLCDFGPQRIESGCWPKFKAEVDEQHHRQIQQTGHFCRTSLHPSIAIKKTSYAFRYTNIRLLTILII